jgi:hypothetical protein
VTAFDTQGWFGVETASDDEIALDITGIGIVHTIVALGRGTATDSSTRARSCRARWKRWSTSWEYQPTRPRGIYSS